MNGHISKIGHDGQASAPLQEVEFALILARMIASCKEDPEQMRFAVYEFARAKLREEISWADDKERERLLAAFETAIVGVERFSSHNDDQARLNKPAGQYDVGMPAIPRRRNAAVPLEALSIAPRKARFTSAAFASFGAQNRTAMTGGLRFAGVALLGVLIVAGALYFQRGSFTTEALQAPEQTALASAKRTPEPQPTVGAAPAAVAPEPSFPLPAVYGVYALNNGVLHELSALSEQVPDKRVAVSTPVNRPSRITLASGQVSFVVFRRDFAADAPERADVRVVARVTRAMTFDAKGRGSFTPVNDSWNIRNVAHEFRVKPIPGHPEMLLLQPEKSDFVLPAGRYVLALKSQGYDFSVGGEITDISQCLERTEATNGIFYSACEK